MTNSLKEKFTQKILPKIKDTKAWVGENSNKIVEKVTLSQLYGGMRDSLCLITETSLLDNEKGILFRGYSIDDIYKNLSKYNGLSQPTPEIIFYLLLLGELPSEEDVASLTSEWHSRAKVPSHVYKVVDAFDNFAHPMYQLASAISALETESLFNKAYKNGIKKSSYWEYVYEDVMNLIATLPKIVAYIYNKNYNNNKSFDYNKNLDYAGNFANLMGDTDSSKCSLMKDFFRMYLFLHSDHEGGNASAFSAHVTGSTLASPYASMSTATHSLSGPLHGMACENSLAWIQNIIKHFGKAPTKEEIANYIDNALATGDSVPGYGHAVLRITDPRFTAQLNFSKHYQMKDEILETVWNTYEVAPKVLGKLKKIKNPYPNVDAHSGAILHYLGFKNPEFYTVLFAMARSLGVGAQQIWDRALGNPIHRPRSTTSEKIKSVLK